MLDMKRLVTALGHPNNGFKGTLDELKKLDHPAIVAIHYMNFKHFVALKNIKMVAFLSPILLWVILVFPKLSLMRCGIK